MLYGPLALGALLPNASPENATAGEALKQQFHAYAKLKQLAGRGEVLPAHGATDPNRPGETEQQLNEAAKAAEKEIPAKRSLRAVAFQVAKIAAGYC